MIEAYLDSGEVMRLLGIKQQTLYAYASRGLIARTIAPGARRSLYAREDVEKLLARKLTRHGGAGEGVVGNFAAHGRSGRGVPAPAGVESINSAITEITPAGPRYRGRDACALAVHPGGLENVAELLWSGVLIHEPVSWEFDPFPGNLEAAIAALGQADHPVPILQIMATASVVLGESAAGELRSGNTTRLARRLVFAYAGCLRHLCVPGQFMRRKEGESIAALALRALGAKATPAALAAVNAVLICCADHELSPATYAARVVASTGAGLHACMLAAIAGHSGHVLGGSCDRVENLFAARHAPQRLREMVAAAGEGGASLPGFGNLIYPQGDPRGQYLFELAVNLAAPKALADIQLLVELAQTEAGLSVSLEVGLVALARALGLPARSASALWAVGRSTGWVAHVMEQRLAGTLIRPRARHQRL